MRRGRKATDLLDEAAGLPKSEPHDRIRFVDDRLLNAAQRSVRQLLRQEVPAIIDLRGLEEYEKWLRPLLIAVARRARANHSGFGESRRPPREIPPIPAESRMPAYQLTLSHLSESLIRSVRSASHGVLLKLA